MVFRTYVEKLQGLAPECEALLTDCRDFLGVQGLRAARIWNRYDVEGIEAPLFENACRSVFSEPPLDLVSDAADTQDACAVFAVEPLPGQFDQRADSASQCIQLLSQGERPRIRTAKVYALYGMLTDADVEAVKRYVINPVESREASLAKPETLAEELAEPKCVSSVEGFTAMDEAGLSALLSSMGLAMDIADLKALQDYFRETERRDPTVTELRVVDTYWSDHCRHTTFSTHLDEIRIDDDAVKGAYARYLAAREEVYGAERAAKRPQTLMDIATIGTKTLKARGLLPELDESEEINACSIHVPAMVNGKEQDWLLMFKNETHNHPTEIEPFGGAATCIGGCIRDPLSGRAYVHQAMRVTGGGDPRKELAETLSGKLPQRKLAQTAAAGYSSYGNQIGLATGHIAELYHEGYVAKRLECGAVVAAAPADNVVRERPAPGDVVILLGGRTGRDGIGGATGSSKSHDMKSLSTMASEVQKGNAPEERKIQRLFRDGAVTRLIKRCNDFGAGGEGKSRIGVVMQKLLGGNLKNGSIAKVERSPFARADLEHELLMVDDDMKMEALKSTHYLKSLITAEMPMDLERKGEQSYQGQMYVRFLAFSNGDLESLYDHSDGFYRRQLILSVKKRPPNREDDPFLADKLCGEIEGIFLWCLEGLRRLQANSFRFTESTQTKANREDARQEADNVLLFLRSEGYIRLKADSTITSANLYAIYTMWCSDNAYKPLAARTVSMTLKKHADEFGLEHDNHIQNALGKRVNGFWGIEALVTPPVL